MGEYNPHLPHILGQEWVPIRDESIQIPSGIATTELGYTFKLPGTHVADNARVYIHRTPQGITNDYMTVNVYRSLSPEHGPIRQAIIPAATAATSGVDGTGSNPAFDGFGTVDSIQNPSTGAVIGFTTPSGFSRIIGIAFSVDDYIQLLSGKRFLDVGLLYSGYAYTSMPTGSSDPLPLTMQQGWGLNQGVRAALATYSNSAVNALYGPLNYFVANGSEGRISPAIVSDYAAANASVQYISLGNMLVNDASNDLISNITGLLRLAPGGDRRVTLTAVLDSRLPGGTSGPSGNTLFATSYVALVVTFCEEERVATGAGRVLFDSTNVIPLRDPQTNAASPSLSSGEYLVTASASNIGELSSLSQASTYTALVNGLRELYPVSHRGKKIIHPTPVNEHVGDVLTVEDSIILPQISLHEADNDTLTEPHAYGRQAPAQVWGTVYAEQEILDTPVGVPAEFPWVRFYARRFGDTKVPLRLTGMSAPISGCAVEITPIEFDVLDEIIDGWREVTLRFDCTNTMGTFGGPLWRWTALNELVGNRWEVLSAAAPALSGLPGDLFNQAPLNARLYAATYYAPTGADQELKWMPQGIASPPISGTGIEDDATDAVLIFAQDPPAVSGLTVTSMSQAISGIGQNCGIDPCCIPTEIKYNHLTWDEIAPLIADDDFERTTAAGSWNNLSGGGSWTVDGGTIATDYFVANGAGTMVTDGTTTTRRATVDGTSFLDVRAITQLSFPAIPSTGENSGGIMLRYQDVSNYYMIDVSILDDGNLRLRIRRRVAAVNTSFVSISNLISPYTPDQLINTEFEAVGDMVRARIWLDGTERPDWQIEAIAGQIDVAGQVGLRSVSNTGSVTTDFSVNYHMFQAYDISATGCLEGSIEIQRMDTVDTEWQTIMACTDITVTGFNDYEARVGIESSYQIHAVDIYDFPGPWSATVTGTVEDPGVTIGCDDGHLLIFTSNERQDGALNLAYSTAWEGRVQEDFTFTEAGFIQLQTMYNRDFVTAFRPLERGGERFRRDVLVQAAAISPETLADFTSLRDMAWADTSYICVRDEDGNRWFATVLVPSGRVTFYRRIYIAPVEIIEVTDTPSRVDPS